jgi:hypothetical protein
VLSRRKRAFRCQTERSVSPGSSAASQIVSSPAMTLVRTHAHTRSSLDIVIVSPSGKTDNVTDQLALTDTDQRHITGGRIDIAPTIPAAD